MGSGMQAHMHDTYRWPGHTRMNIYTRPKQVLLFLTLSILKADISLVKYPSGTHPTDVHYRETNNK